MHVGTSTQFYLRFNFNTFKRFHGHKIEKVAWIGSITRQTLQDTFEKCIGILQFHPRISIMQKVVLVNSFSFSEASADVIPLGERRETLLVFLFNDSNYAFVTPWCIRSSYPGVVKECWPIQPYRHSKIVSIPQESNVVSLYLPPWTYLHSCV